MNLLARKVSRAKWDPKPYLGDGISADAVTGGCIRTSGEKLSVWECDENRDDVSQIVLATISSKKAHVEGLHIALLRKEELASSGIKFEKSLEDADTAMTDLRDRHHNLIELDLERVVIISRVIARAVRGGIDSHMFTKGQVGHIVL